MSLQKEYHGLKMNSICKIIHLRHPYAANSFILVPIVPMSYKKTQNLTGDTDRERK
jgi:hypothetical protein